MLLGINAKKLNSGLALNEVITLSIVGGSKGSPKLQQRNPYFIRRKALLILRKAMPSFDHVFLEFVLIGHRVLKVENFSIWQAIYMKHRKKTNLEQVIKKKRA